MVAPFGRSTTEGAFDAVMTPASDTMGCLFHASQRPVDRAVTGLGPRRDLRLRCSAASSWPVAVPVVTMHLLDDRLVQQALR